MQFLSTSLEKHVREKNCNPSRLSGMRIFDGNVVRNISRILRM